MLLPPPHSLPPCKITLTTIGLGDFVPTTTGSRVFSFFFVFVGLGLWGVLLNAASEFLKRKHSLIAPMEEMVASPVSTDGGILQRGGGEEGGQDVIPQDRSSMVGQDNDINKAIAAIRELQRESNRQANRIQQLEAIIKRVDNTMHELQRDKKEAQDIVVKKNVLVLPKLQNVGPPALLDVGLPNSNRKVPTLENPYYK
jgi:hypothetical protein